MVIVSVRHAAPGGTITYKLAEVLAEYAALNSLRVRILTTGQVRHVHHDSVVWGLATSQPKGHALHAHERVAPARHRQAWELEHLREHCARLSELVGQQREQIAQLRHSHGSETP